MIVYVRREQAELLLRLKNDVGVAESIVRQAQGTLNTACAGVLAGLVPDQTAVAEVRVEGERGVIVTADMRGAS